MIKIYDLDGVKVVDSHAVYEKIGLTTTNYNRWIKKYKDRGGRDIDWFINNDLLKLNRRIKNRYFLTLDFARGICIGYVTKGSNELIVFLKQEMTK